MSIFYSSIHKILLLANMGGGSVLLFVFQRRFLDFYKKNYIVLKLRKNFSFRARFFSRKTSQTIPTLQHTFSCYWRRPVHSKSWLMPLSPLFKSIHDWTEIFDICWTQVTVFSWAPTQGSFTALQCRTKDTGHYFLKVWHVKGLGNFFTLTLFSLISFDSYHSPLIKGVFGRKKMKKNKKKTLLWINFQKWRLNSSASFFKPLLSPHC